MHDKIFLRDLRVETIIGIFEWERQTRQTVSIDLTMPGDIRRAAASDHIDDTFNYQAVAEQVVRLTEGSSFQLVETLAERIADLCLNEFGMAWIDVRVNKPGAVERAQDVGVMIHRGVRDNGRRREVFVGLGSNVEPGRHLALALDALSERFGAVARSTAYENPAVDIDGASFVNLVASFLTEASPHTVRDALRDIDQRISAATGNTDQKTALGLHLLLHGDITLADQRVTLPHPDVMRFAFFLRPLAELAAHRHHPTSGETWARVWAGSGLHRHAMTPVDLPRP